MVKTEEVLTAACDCYLVWTERNKIGTKTGLREKDA
jgi:hypothetical protein